MNASTTPLVAELSPLASRWGVDLAPLAVAEMAFNDMLTATLARDDAAYFEAKARFDSCRKDARK